MMLSAIHQPNFLPWFGYFHKIAMVDSFIFFDSVSLSNGKSWTSRCQILLNGKPHWLTMPIKTKGRSGQQICTVELQDFKQDWQRILATIHQAYRRSPHFDSVFEVLNAFQTANFTHLSALNIALITTISQHLGLTNTYFELSSSKPELLTTTETKTSYIVQTCQAFEVKNYLTGKGGSLAFLDLTEFEKAEISINFQEFEHPIYPQIKTDSFVKGLSIIDILMNLGWEKTGLLLPLSPQ